MRLDASHPRLKNTQVYPKHDLNNREQKQDKVIENIYPLLSISIPQTATGTSEQEEVYLKPYSGTPISHDAFIPGTGYAALVGAALTDDRLILDTRAVSRVQESHYNGGALFDWDLSVRCTEWALKRGEVSSTGSTDECKATIPKSERWAFFRSDNGC